jgi:hypothetical protein
MHNLITFACPTELLSVAAPPIRASESLPDWYRKLPATDTAEQKAAWSGATVKRCMPFQDAMATGWILVTPFDIRLEVNEDGSSVTDGADMPFPTIESHQQHQIRGHPFANRVALKFIMPWTISTPPGWSTLFTPLLNRENEMFDVMSGIVDTDKHAMPVNIPFFLKPKGRTIAVDRGTPICQLIPFFRGDLEPEVRALTSEESLTATRQSFAASAMAGWYRKLIRAKR